MMDKRFVLIALNYAIVGMLLGISMSASKNFSQGITHAHILLVGFVVPMAYGVCYRLWLEGIPKWWAEIQFYLHQFGTAIMVVGLYSMFGAHYSEDSISPFLAIASLMIVASMVMMTFFFIKSTYGKKS